MDFREIKMPTVLQQSWEQYITSWIKELDGVSLHKTPENHSSFLKNIQDVEEFFKPIGSPIPIEVSQELFDQIEEDGVWISPKDMMKFKLSYKHQEKKE